MVLNELLGQTKVIYEVTKDYFFFLLKRSKSCKRDEAMMIVGKVSEPMPQVIRTQPALYTARFPSSKTFKTFFFRIIRSVTL